MLTPQALTRTPVDAHGSPQVSVEILRRGRWLQLLGSENYELKRVRIGLRQVRGQPMRLLHLSDLHLTHRWSRGLDELIQRTNADPPDLILFTGDFVDSKIDPRPALPLVERLVTQLRSHGGILAIGGNHDGDMVLPMLARWGVAFVGSQRVIAQVGDAQIEIIGLPGAERDDLTNDFLESIPPPQPDMPRIVLGHYPDELKRTLPLRPDLYLSGHTHGGQICLPGGRPIITHDTLPRHMARGVHVVDKTVLIVNHGLGYSTIPVRLFSPPEVIEIVLANDIT